MKQTSTLKKLLAVFTFLIITAITLTLASCGTGNWNTEEEDSTAETKQEALAPITFDFESNGDGTCKITGVSINDSTLTDINLEFPQKSPAGEDVTVIDLAPSTTYGNVPTMILREDFEKLKDTIEANIAANDRENKFLFDKSMSFYSFQDPSTVSDYIKEAMLKKYPVTQITAVYILDVAMITNAEYEKLSNVLFEFGGYTQEKAQSDYQKLIDKVQASDICTPEILVSIRTVTYKHSNITSVTIPHGIEMLNGFYLPHVKDILIPNTVTSIGNGAFDNCSSLTSVTIGDSVTSIGEEAFYGCSSLASITIPNSVTSIGDSAFSGCECLIQKENGVSYVDKWIIDCDSDVITAVLRSDTVGIADGAFDNCDNLTSITIPDGVTNIGDGAFSGCSSLDSITIPVGVTSINNYAFSNCTRLTSITIPDSVTSIGYYAFNNCSGLTSITIPEGVTSIGSHAFSYCSSLTNITVAEGNTKYKSDGNCLIKISSNTLIRGCKNSVIPNYVTSIGDGAFSGCESLTSITIPGGVTHIGDSALSNCTSLTSITIPDSVTSIGGSAFYNCSSLESITIPDSVTSIGDYAFYNCDSLTIYCEAASQPKGWDSDWNSSNRPVTWGYVVNA